ncbi:hypothetical protein ACFXAE_30310 [Streptomyces sp. NPDC059454]|uniref:hypothetical protein n=1 Tax=Streptomyces sp. NPDC059454 TaxID=3346836 RepID=UPI00369CF349
MRKFQKAAVVVAMLGSVGFLGAGVSHAGDEPSFKLDNDQTTSCSADESAFGGLVNVSDVNVVANVLAGVQGQATDISSATCNATLGLGG